jgi:hypothetical protein
MIFHITFCSASNLLTRYTHSFAKTKILYCAALIALLSGNLHAACHTVTPSGSGSKTGADWNNALANVPATLTRGDIYYLADGNYGGYTFGTAVSGSTNSEIRKAQTGDHCTDTGFNAGTMAASQANFTSFAVGSSFFILNGNGTQTKSGCGGAPGATVTGAPPNPVDCGIKITSSSISPFTIVNNAGHYTVQYLEEIGNGVNNGALAEFYGGSGGSVSKFSHIYAHNSGCVFFQYGGDQREVGSSYFWGTEVDGAPTGSCHGQYSFYLEGSNSLEHDNVYRDIRGTAVFTLATFSGIHGVADNWKYYNNVIFNSSSSQSWNPTLSDGIISCIANSGTGETLQCSHQVFVQNTIINLAGQTGINNDCTDGCGAGSSYTVQNNIWYSSTTPAFIQAATGTFTQDHNSCLNSGSCPTGTANVTNTSSANPFVSWTTGNFTLASDGTDWNNRASLSAPFTTDALGITRTTDRGTYQFGGSGTGPNPPSGLSAAAN